MRSLRALFNVMLYVQLIRNFSLNKTFRKLNAPSFVYILVLKHSNVHKAKKIRCLKNYLPIGIRYIRRRNKYINLHNTLSLHVPLIFCIYEPILSNRLQSLTALTAH